MTTPTLLCAAGRANRFEIFDRAIDEAAGAFAAGDRRHERIRTGRQHHVIVGQGSTFRRAHAASFAIDADGLVIQMERDVVALEEVFADERQIRRGSCR